MHKNMPISLFKTPFDHFHFHPPPQSFEGLYWNCVLSVLAVSRKTPIYLINNKLIFHIFWLFNLSDCFLYILIWEIWSKMHQPHISQENTAFPFWGLFLHIIRIRLITQSQSSQGQSLKVKSSFPPHQEEVSEQRPFLSSCGIVADQGGFDSQQQEVKEVQWRGCWSRLRSEKISN